MTHRDVFCKHKWSNHGPNTRRCEVCREIWRDIQTTEEPKVVIGYVDAVKWDGVNRRKEVIFRGRPSADKPKDNEPLNVI